ncbi:pyridoxamine 5'-phosphate oxidase family protein [Tepidanaerobacter syntrophicus]|uniref:pyridoxamine 5'-phosphate oxidase family protein n=1 Tax=Tepidanaerobacter syntrophicus TaxID=224999 RepID=UPI001BD4FEF2|nr:pyridoxamine 5'-phosphate oxidase family protein [Tepidanaerobacter syntrophicus]
MEELVKILNDAPEFFIATVNGDKPRIRPFGFAMYFKEKLYLCTGNHKNVYKELRLNPNIQICVMISDEKWLRISSKVAFDESIEAKEKAFAISPNLAEIYGMPTNERFEVFYLTEVTASIYEMDKKLGDIGI